MNVRLIVPNSYVSGSHAMVINPVYQYGKAIADIAGGFTATQATGGWIGPDGSLVVEPVTVFDISCPSPADNTPESLADAEQPIVKLRLLAKRIASDLKQDCVYLAIDGIAEFVR